MGMQIKTYLPNAQAKAFDRLATKMEMSRYELALLAIQDFITRGDPKEVMNNPDLSLPEPEDQKLRSTKESRQNGNSDTSTAQTDSSTKASEPANSPAASRNNTSNNSILNTLLRPRKS